MTKQTKYHTSLVSAFDARAKFEKSKDAKNTNIQNTLSALKKSVDHADIAKVFASAKVDADFINSSERQNARFNVYAANKVVNIARAIASVAALNHYTKAVFASALALEAKKMTLQHKDANSACSLSCASDKERESVIVKYQKHVAANTAATQSSSSINALQRFNILTESRDDSNNIQYTVNRSSDATKALAKQLQIAL